MAFDVNPVPEMVCQTFKIGIMLGLPIIDPTCGRYCLKSLLKYHYEAHLGTRLADVTLPKPTSRLSDWMGYDPYDDFQHAGTLLKKIDAVPTTPAGWEALLRARGPLILAGKLGRASVPHYILLTGIDDTGAGTFHFKDPLAGDTVGTEAFATMQPRIETPIVAAHINIGALLTTSDAYHPTKLANLPFA